MNVSNSPRYPLHIRILHWLSAALLIGMLVSGVFMVRMDDANVWKYERLYNWHQWFGMLALLLINIRLLARLLARLPALPKSMGTKVRIAARIGHVLLYALMMIIPVIGWVMSSTYPESQGMSFFGWPIPRFIAANGELYESTKLMHWTLAYGFAGLVALHVAAAIKHRYFAQPSNNILSRIL